MGFHGDINNQNKQDSKLFMVANQLGFLIYNYNTFYMYFSCAGPGSRGAAISGVSVSKYGAQRTSHTTAGNPLPD